MVTRGEDFERVDPWLAAAAHHDTGEGLVGLGVVCALQHR